MSLIKCPNGHFYDDDRFGVCPHCSNSGAQNFVTEAVSETFETTMIDETVTGVKTTTTEDTRTQSSVTGVKPVEDDIAKTVGFYESDMGLEPVVGWLVCVKGPHFGKDFRIVSGRNFIGRGEDMDIVIEDYSVSRKAHSVVVYEPKGNIYLLQPGTSKELCYLNDQVVLEAKQLSANDVITVGSTQLMFIPCCSDSFNWSDYKAVVE